MQNGYETNTFTGNMAGAMTAQAIIDAPLSPVPSELRNLDRSIAKLDKVISQLAGRLEPVCRTEPPTPVGAGSEQRSRAASGLGGQIAACADQLDGLALRVSGILNRCEL